MRFRLVPVLALAFCFVCLTGCGGDGQKPRSLYRLVHAVSDAGPVDVWLEGNRTKLFENVRYKDVTAARTLAPGTYNFQLRPAGAPSSTAPVAESGDIVVGDEGGAYTFIAAGLSQVDAAEPNAARVLAIEQAFGPVSANEASIRLVHAAPGAPALDVTVDDNDPLPDDDNDRTVTDLAPYTSTDALGIPVDAADPEQVQCFDAATDAFLTAFTTPGLVARGEYLAIFLGSLDVLPREAGAFEWLVVADDGLSVVIRQNPRVYLMNTVADAPSIDAWFRPVDGSGVPVGDPLALETGLLFGELGGDSAISLVLEPGNYEFSFTIPLDNPYPTVQPMLGAGNTGSLAAGEQYLFCVGGRADQTYPFQLIGAQEQFDLAQAQPENEDLWRIVHSAPDLTAVFFGRVVANTFIQMTEFPLSISPGDTTAPEGVDIGLPEFVLAIVRQNFEEEYGLWDIVPEAAARRFVVLLGSRVGTVAPETFEPVRLAFVDTTMMPWTTTSQFPLSAPD